MAYRRRRGGGLFGGEEDDGTAASRRRPAAGAQQDDGEEEEDEGPPGTDLYAVLNVPRDASEEEVQRAYRSLAKTFHPDKHQDPALHAAAAASFTRLNEAYTILSDPERRQVYDVYGMEGLNSGLELGSKLSSREELRAQWTAFKTRKRHAEVEAAVNYSGVCVLGLDCEDVPRGRSPEMTAANMLSSVQAPLTAKDTLSLGGNIVTKPGVGGGGSFIMGYQRDCSVNSSLSLHAETGLRSVLQLTSTRQLSQRSSASLTASWTPEAGVGLEVSSHRQISDAVAGELAMVLGPAGAEGVALTLRRTADKTDVNGTLHVGAQTGVTAAVVHSLSARSGVRAAVKLGTMGLEVELGGSRRMGDYGSAGMSVTIGIQGITLKLRLARGGQKFVFPCLIFTHYGWRTALASALLPPLAFSVAKYALVKPLLRYMRDKERLEARSELLSTVSEALANAEAERQLLEPVAKRKTRKEAQAGGLVVVAAVYGTRRGLEAWQREQDPTPGAADATNDAPVQEWCDVTVATQFLVDNRCLVFHQGVSKAGLMGFYDMAPGESKELWVMYLLGGVPCRSQVGDHQGCRLPADGAPVGDPQLQELIVSIARGLDLPP